MIGKGLGIVVNRLTVGFVFAFIYQAITGVVTSILSIPLTGTVNDLILGIENPDASLLAIAWWIISTIMFPLIAVQLMRIRRYISPYKKENMDAPPNVTIVSLVILGAMMSITFYLMDLVVGSSSVANVSMIYQAAAMGDFVPLTISIVFSIVAGFVVVGVMGRAKKVRELTRGVGSVDRLRRKLARDESGTKTIAGTRGMAPGTAIFVGTRKVEKAWFSTMRYNEASLQEVSKTHDISTCLEPTTTGVNWINMTGIHDKESIIELGRRFGLHELRISDILNTDMRPKTDVDKNNIFVALKMPHYDATTSSSEKVDVMVEHISVVLGPDYVLSFQETEEDVFDKVRENIRKFKGQFRTMGSDYLAYALIDAIVDTVFVILEDLGDKTEDIEDNLIDNPNQKTLEAIYDLKREMVMLRRIISPMREVINALDRTNSPLIHDNTKKYLQDAYNHAVQTMEVLESLRDTVAGMLDTYLSIVSNKTNDVMKTLTIIASIFIPTTFVAGVYGTNFAHIPELDWEYGYFVMLGIMATISGFMLVWFRKKSWL